MKLINLHNIHGNYFSIFALPLLSRQAKVIWTLHDAWAVNGKSPYFYKQHEKNANIDEEISLKDYPAMPKNRIGFFKKAKKLIYKFSKLTIICPSDALCEYIKTTKMFPKGTKIITINNGINLSKFKGIDQKQARSNLNLPLDKKIIYMQAGWVEDSRKGIIDAIKTMKLDKPEDICILITGHNSKIIKQYLPKNLGGVRLEEYVDNEKISLYFIAADIYAFPSKFENYSTTLLEAHAAGVPSVAFDIGGNSEIIDNKTTGILIDPYEFDKFWARINKLISNDKEKLEMSKQAKIKSKNFSIEKSIEKYLNLFEQTK